MRLKNYPYPMPSAKNFKRVAENNPAHLKKWMKTLDLPGLGCCLRALHTVDPTPPLEEIILEYMNHEMPWVREASCYLASMMDSAAIREKLTKLSSEDVKSVREAALRVLGLMEAGD